MAKDAKKTPEQKPAASAGNLETDSQSVRSSSEQPAAQRKQPVVAPSTVINIAVHSLLMITVPFALFFASLLGGFDPLFQLTGSQVPRQETKTYIGAGLAVLGVNLVICSFVISAFKEDSERSLKQE